MPVKEAKAKLTDLLCAVDTGEQVVVTRHGEAVALLTHHLDEKPEKHPAFLAVCQVEDIRLVPNNGRLLDHPLAY